MSDFRIINFHADYKKAFYELNRRWIEQHYKLEEEDKRFLADPKRYIIDAGGMVFFLLDGEEIAGTCGLINMDADTYELVRMSIDDRFRGKGYAKALIEHSADWAKQRGAKQIILETGSVLKPAITLYESVGFQHYTPKSEHKSGLARADVFMRRAI
jgi:GNAT superfamily N-acetyltransferase